MSKKKIVILGAGTGGTITANRLAKNRPDISITLVDQHEKHYYQPGFLFLPFDIYKEEDVVKNKKDFIPSKVNYVQEEIDKIEADDNKVILKNGDELSYDLLVIATGSKTFPSETPGMLEDEWQKSIFDFYTFEGAVALRDKLKDWPGGKLVINITEMPIKCPVAPIEFSFLADDFFSEKGIRDKVDIKFVTPLSGAFTKPTASEKLGYLFKDKNIEVVADFSTAKIDTKTKEIVSYDDKKVKFDLLVTVPTNMGDPMIERSGLGDELNFVPTNRHTLQSETHENIFVIGDATNVPASKAGSVVHFESETLIHNIDHYLKGEKIENSFDGHANCFVETGHGKAMLIDFNYDQEPVTGVYPLPVGGPMHLLEESRLNHLGKHAFRWVYWNLLLQGHDIPGIPSQMIYAGKNTEEKSKKE